LHFWAHDIFKITARVQGAADALQLPHLLDRKPKQLSGGHRAGEDSCA